MSDRFEELARKVIHDARARGCTCELVEADFAHGGGKTVTVEIMHSTTCPLDADYYAEVLP